MALGGRGGSGLNSKLIEANGSFVPDISQAGVSLRIWESTDEQIIETNQLWKLDLQSQPELPRPTQGLQHGSASNCCRNCYPIAFSAIPSLKEGHLRYKWQGKKKKSKAPKPIGIIVPCALMKWEGYYHREELSYNADALSHWEFTEW